MNPIEKLTKLNGFKRHCQLYLERPVWKSTVISSRLSSEFLPDEVEQVGSEPLMMGNFKEHGLDDFCRYWQWNTELVRDCLLTIDLYGNRKSLCKLYLFKRILIVLDHSFGSD